MAAISAAAIAGAAAPAQVAGDDVRQRLSAAARPLVPGDALAVVVVQRDGQTLLAEAFGSYDGGDCREMLPDASIDVTLLHRFDIGSVAKMFTAAAILRLQMQGKLDVHDPVAQHVDDLVGLVGRHRRITIHHLLTHTSGLPTDVSFADVDLNDRDASLRYVLGLQLQHEPGEVYAYNNIGYFALAALVERISGERFETYVQREVFAPAKMMHSGFVQEDDVDAQFDTARVSGRMGGCIGSATMYAWSWGFRGATGVVCTAGDLVRWHHALMNDSVLNADARAIMFEPAKGGYSCGWFVGLDDEGRAVQWHGGGTPGFRTMYSRFPGDDAVIVTLCDEQCNPNAIDAAIREALFADGGDGKPAGPAIKATMHFAGHGLERDAHGVLKASQDLSFDVLQNAGEDEAAVRVVLSVRSSDAVLVSIDMRRAIARTLAMDIANTLDAKPADMAEPESPEVCLASMVYQPDDEGVVNLSKTVKWMVMPRYVGMDDQGNRLVDERTTVVLRDDARQFWPVILRLDRESAQTLSAALQDASR